MIRTGGLIGRIRITLVGLLGDLEQGAALIQLRGLCFGFVRGGGRLDATLPGQTNAFGCLVIIGRQLLVPAIGGGLSGGLPAGVQNSVLKIGARFQVLDKISGKDRELLIRTVCWQMIQGLLPLAGGIDNKGAGAGQNWRQPACHTNGFCAGALQKRAVATGINHRDGQRDTSGFQLIQQSVMTVLQRNGGVFQKLLELGLWALHLGWNNIVDPAIAPAMPGIDKGNIIAGGDLIEEAVKGVQGLASAEILGQGNRETQTFQCLSIGFSVGMGVGQIPQFCVVGISQNKGMPCRRDLRGEKKGQNQSQKTSHHIPRKAPDSMAAMLADRSPSWQGV